MEFGPLLGLVVQDFSGSIIEFNNFRRVLDENPCRRETERGEREKDRARDRDIDSGIAPPDCQKDFLSARR